MTTTVYEGGFEGFWTAVYEAYAQKSWPDALYRKSQEPPQTLFEQRGYIEPNPPDARRAAEAFYRKAGSEAFSTLYHAWCADSLAIDLALLGFVRALFKNPAHYENWSDPVVKTTREAARFTLHETHRWQGFTRFAKLKTGEFYGAIGPKSEILQPLSAHFRRRMGNERWILHDTLRNQAWVHSAAQSRMFTVEKTDQPAFHSEEDVAQALWQTFFKSHTINDRLSRKRQLKWVAKRFHPFMNEMR